MENSWYIDMANNVEKLENMDKERGEEKSKGKDKEEKQPLEVKEIKEIKERQHNTIQKETRFTNQFDKTSCSGKSKGIRSLLRI